MVGDWGFQWNHRIIGKGRRLYKAKKTNGVVLEVINFCALKDLGYVGPRFTWLFQQRDGFQIRERLDRALGSSDWLVLFPRASLHHLSSSVSDHSPLSLHLKNRPCKRSKRRLFWFESIWLKDARFEEVVKEAWEEGEVVGSNWAISNCLERCKVELMRWNKEGFGNVGVKVAELQARLAFLEI